MFKRNRLAMLVAEFLGTGFLTLTVLSVQRSQLGLAYFVAIAAGLAILALTYTFGMVSGAHFNPALTFALWTARRVGTLAGIVYIIAQLLGAWAAYGLYRYFVNTDVQAVHQAFNGRILVAEAIGTLLFALAWAAAAYNRYETSKFAVVSGVGFMAALIVASAASVGLANPALAVGARAWDVFGKNGWGNYVLGPVLGAVIGVNLFALLFAEPDSPFRFFRRSAAVRGGRATTAAAVVEDDDLDEDDEEEAVVAAEPVVTSRSTRTRAAASGGNVKVSRSRKGTARKTTTSRRKR